MWIYEYLVKIIGTRRPQQRSQETVNKTKIKTILIQNIIFALQSLKIRAYQQTADLEFSFLKAELNDHTVRLRVTCGQQVESKVLLTFYIAITAIIKQLPKFFTLIGWYQSHTLAKNFSLTSDRTRAAPHSTTSKLHALNLMTTGPGQSKIQTDLL